MDEIPDDRMDEAPNRVGKTGVGSWMTETKSDSEQKTTPMTPWGFDGLGIWNNPWTERAFWNPLH